MIISTSWLADFVQLPVTADELVDRLALAGLNHESSTPVGDDMAIELEVTSNRPDCLGHIGVAREAAVLFERPLAVPDPRPLEGSQEATGRVGVAIESPEICPFYSARVIRGVRIGPSPGWLVDRLRTVGVASVNNVVDVTNYVMLESGQPLHAFDLARIHGGRIVVRRAVPGEPFLAINHKTYALDDRMCVIADAERPVALAGVMGGADSEITEDTVDVLLESAQFAPLPVRAAARSLVLASGSSYRFERGPDPAMVDWASRRAAALILELAGGVLDRGVATAGELASTPATITLAPERVAEVLGVEIPPERQQKILGPLGFRPEGGTNRWLAPTWRRDCWREIDLVEEIARIEGYEGVPEDVPIAARPASLSDRELAVRRVGEVLVGQAFCEAMTRSVVDERLSEMASPWSTSPAMVISPALVRGADRLRRSLLPSLLEARAGNAAVGVHDADLFEIARAYLAWPASQRDAASPAEEPLLAAFVSSGGFLRGKGLAEAMLTGLGVTDQPAAVIDYRPLELAPFAPGRAAEIVLTRAGQPACRVGVVGEIAADILAALSLAEPVVAAELRLDRLDFAVGSQRPLERPGEFPAVERDINLVVAENVPWGEVEQTIRSAGGELLESVRLAEVWRDAERLGEGRKSFVITLTLRSRTGTLTGEEATAAVQTVIDAATRQCGASLRG